MTAAPPRLRLALLACGVLSRVALAAEEAAPDGYLVAPFENASPVRALDWMAPALAVTLAEQVEAVPRLRPLYGAQILDGWPARFDEGVALTRAREAGARYVFTGSFSRPNWRAGVKVRLLEVDAARGQLREVAHAEAVGERTALLAVLDQALDQVLVARGLGVDGEALAALHRAPTADLYAFTLFGRALAAQQGLGTEVSLEQAQKTLERVVHIDPKFAEAHRALAEVYLARGDTARASGQLGHALDLRPAYFAALAGLSRIEHERGKRQAARELCERALAVRPWDAEVRLLLGTVEWEAGELDKALADLKAVTAVRDGSAPAHRVLASVQAARGDVPALAAELERLSQLLPDDNDVRLELAAAWSRLPREDKALAVYDEVTRRQPRNAIAWKLAGDTARRLGDPQRAATAYERLRHLLPDDPRPPFLLGAAYAEAGRDDKAVAVLEEAAQTFHGYAGDAWSDLGALALRRGDLKRAEGWLVKAVARAPLRPRPHFNYALLLDVQGLRERALDESRAAAELDPEEADYRYLSGVLLLRMGRFDDAKGEFAAAVKVKPDHADARHNLELLESLERRYGSERAGAGSR